MPATAHSTTRMRAFPVVVPAATLTCARVCATGAVGAVMFLLASAGPSPAAAQSVTPATPSTGCEQPAHQAETPVPQGSNSGTQPGSASTGWSGATGGSFTGTTNQVPTPGSPSDHPQTVTGVDPKVGSQRKC
ncbi:hypothetical protein ABLE93_02780 [Xanthobacter sp. KR7-65]|uniref:hypothetical protein n=1 Tax=Xanthobacter sp. KR7-65 TaxID=3156612 RepID=UPI0032B5AF9C